MTAHLYKPFLRPAGRYTLPEGVTWDYVETPAMVGLANRPDLPQSRYQYGVIKVSRKLTHDEATHLDLCDFGPAP